MTDQREATEFDLLYRSIERLAEEWQGVADQAASGGYVTALSPATCAAALRNRLADVNPSPAGGRANLVCTCISSAFGPLTGVDDDCPTHGSAPTVNETGEHR